VEPFALEGEDQLGPVSDIGPLALALGAAIRLGARKVSLVGFDGYANATRAQRQLTDETQVLIDRFRRRPSSAPVSSLTPTEYVIPTNSVYSRLVALNRSR
jgi:4-hydroxy 2-oxovalerate aldolase